MDVFEEGPEFEKAHREIDGLGSTKRQKFPEACRFRITENLCVEMTCDVYLAHDRFGFSPGIKINEMKCSICNEHPNRCQHVTGRVYNEEICQIVILEADILEISIVPRPSYAHARPTMVQVNVDADTSMIGETAICHGCLSACQGLRRPFG